MIYRIGLFIIGICLIDCPYGPSTALRSASAQELEYPISAAVTDDGIIYVADTRAPAIWKIEGGQLQEYFDASKKYRTPLNRPRCLAIDAGGNLLAGDSSTREVYRFDDSGKPVPLTDGGIGIPRAIVVMPDGNLMVADQELHCIWQVPAGGGKPEKFVPVPGLIAMCGDQDGNLYVTSGPRHQLRKITPEGTIENLVTGGPLEFPQEVTIDDNGNLYIADNYAKAIWKVPSGGKPTKLVEGAPMVNPVGITRVGERLIVTDSHAKAIFEVDASGQLSQFFPAP